MALSVALIDVSGGTAATVSASAKQKFIDKVVSPAQKAQRSYGVPASVSIAQAIVASDWGTSSVSDKANNYFDTRCSASMTAKQFAALADAQVGKPYVLGAEASISNADPAKFDCSELVEWLYGRSGNRITDLAAAQYNATKKVTGSPKVGDLVFLRNNPARSNGIGHVAVLTKKLSNGDWRIIEARGQRLRSGAQHPEVLEEAQLLRRPAPAVQLRAGRQRRGQRVGREHLPDRLRDRLGH
ncbi:C40 family peptidase [Micropruina sp.]|uniref:C40 family peptidase n=1 Tax=Micropruina sp. TaxID=2737536 RepID=UPI0039E4D35E